MSAMYFLKLILALLLILTFADKSNNRKMADWSMRKNILKKEKEM